MQSPKCYLIFDGDGDKTKGAQKGVGKESKLEYEDYIQTLYSTKAHILPQTRMQYNRKFGTATILQQNKAGLNPLYTKLFVHPDLTTISPLKKDDEYI